MAIGVLKGIGLTGTAITIIIISFLYLPVSFLIKKGGLLKDSFPLKTKFQLSCKPIQDCKWFIIFAILYFYFKYFFFIVKY